MTTSKQILIILGIVFGIWYFIHFMHEHTQHYNMRGVCEEKMTTQNRDGDAIYYKILVRYENGEVKELTVNPEEYVNFTKGSTYTFNRSKFVW
jgi:hypothetical protein